MTLRLLVFNRAYHPDVAATGQLLTELSEGLVERRGWAVTVVAGPVTYFPGGARAARRAPARERQGGVEILRPGGSRFPRVRAWGRMANYASYSAAAAVAAARARRPDVVMSLTDPPVLGLVALAAARRWRVPFVFLCQDLLPDIVRVLGGAGSGPVGRLLDRVTRVLLNRAAATVAVGEAMAGRLAAHGADPGRLHVIHNWADRTRIFPGSKKTPASEALGLADGFVVLHSGNLGLCQDLERLVDAAALLRDLPDLRVVFQGDGVRRDAIVQRARRAGVDSVRFLPYASREQLRDVFAAADLQVISLRRGLVGCVVPSKLYGILASGRPYVAAVEPGSEVATLTGIYDSGLVVPPEDPVALAGAIRRLYDDPRLRAALGARGHQAAMHHDRPAAVAAYHQLLTDVIGRDVPAR